MTLHLARERPDDGELAAAVEADLVEHVAAVHRPPIGEVHRTGDAVWFTTGSLSPYGNGVLRASMDVSDVAARVRSLLAPFASRRLPMMWWRFTGPDGAEGKIDVELRGHGLAVDSDRPSMARDLAGFEAPPLPRGASIHRVVNRGMLLAWADVVARAFGQPRFPRSAAVRFSLAHGLGDEVPLRHFLCRMDGAWVGASTLSLGAGVAGLANISVVPEMRGRGLGSAVAAAALAEGLRAGMDVGVLSADREGVRLYERLGFRVVGRHRTFTLVPRRTGLA